MKDKLGTWVHRIGGALLLFVFVWVPVLDGVVAHASFDQHPTFSRYVQGQARDTAVVALAGFKSVSSQAIQPILGQLASHGDVIAVDYSPNRFDGATTSYDVVQQLQTWGYRKAILAGDGMGHLVATDILSWCQQLSCNIQFAVIAYRAPAMHQQYVEPTNYVLEPPNDWAQFHAMVYHPGPVDNWLAGFVHPEYPFSGWVTEERYMVNHPDYQRNSYKGTPLVLVQSQSTTEWQAVFGGGQVVSTNGQQWQAALAQGLQALPAGW